MEPDKSFLQIFKTESEKTELIIKNTLIMLGNRIYVDKGGDKHPLLDPGKAGQNIKDKGDNVFIIEADNGEKYVLKIFFQKINAVTKQSPISSFLEEYATYKKIVVARDYNKKISESRTQFFSENSLLENILDYCDQPRFELLSPKEMELVKKEYNITDYTTSKYTKKDATVKYFALKKGDVIRVIRPSPTSGESIAYRIVQ